MTNKLTVTIGGLDETVDARAALSVLLETIALLKDIESAVLGKSLVHWAIAHAVMNSPLTLTIESSRSKKWSPSLDVTSEFTKAFRILESSKDRPSFFTDAMLSRARSIAKPVGASISTLSFSDTDKFVCVTQTTVAHVEQLRFSDAYKSHGDIEGRLGQITAHEDSHEFAIYDPVSNHKTICIFPELDLVRVRGALKKRVRVNGEVSYKRKDDLPQRVMVESWETLPEDYELPTIEELHALKIDLTFGKSSEDVVADLRAEYVG